MRKVKQQQFRKQLWPVALVPLFHLNLGPSWTLVQFHCKYLDWNSLHVRPKTSKKKKKNYKCEKKTYPVRSHLHSIKGFRLIFDSFQKLGSTRVPRGVRTSVSVLVCVLCLLKRLPFNLFNNRFCCAPNYSLAAKVVSIFGLEKCKLPKHALSEVHWKYLQGQFKLNRYLNDLQNLVTVSVTELSQIHFSTLNKFSIASIWLIVVCMLFY